MRILLTLSAAAALSGTVSAQTPAPSASPAGRIYERDLHERWIAAGRRSTSDHDLRSLLEVAYVDSVRDANGARTVFLRLTPDMYDRGTNPNIQSFGQFTRDASGRLTTVSGALRDRPSLTGAPSLLADQARRALSEDIETTHLALPEARVWEFTTSFRNDHASRGARWIDTLAFDQSYAGGYRQSLHGIRVNMVIRDTSIDGHTVWIVRDSAAVQYADRSPTAEVIAGTNVLLDRTGTGTLVGVELYDPMWGVFRTRNDTIHLTGTQSWTYPDSRSFNAPVTYEATRRFTLLEPAALRGRQAARRDSLNALMNRVRATPAAPLKPPPTLAELLAAGDTAAAFERATFSNPMSRQIDLPSMQVLILGMTDPARALRWGLHLEEAYEEINKFLVARPPAVARDTTEWACEPAACRLLAQQWATAREPRLADLGLEARFVLDPKPWADSVVARAPRDPDVLAGASYLARGVGAPSPTGTQSTLPPPGAAWPEWLDWMSGRNPAFPTVVIPRRDTTIMSKIAFGPSHLHAIQFQRLISGRNIGTELQGQLAAATSDTARAIFRAVLTGLDIHGDPVELATRITSGSTIDRKSAIRDMISAFNDSTPLADNPTAAEIQEHFMAIIFDGAGGWPILENPVTVAGGGMIRPPRDVYRMLTSGGSAATPPRQIRPRASDSVFINATALQPAVIAKWASRGVMITDPSWKPPVDRTPLSLYVPSRVQQMGPFVAMSFGYSYRTPGAAAAPSAGTFATSRTVYLMKTDAGWVLVAVGGYIT